MRWTIQNRLLLVGATGIAAGVLLGGIGLAGMTSIGRSVEQMKRTTLAIRNHMEADMMHDALRTDVLVALGDPAAGGIEAAKKGLEEHAANFRQRVDANLQLKLPREAGEACEKIRPELDAYIAAAEDIVKEAGADRSAAIGHLPAFLEAFEVLEGGMSDVSDKITAANEVNVAAAAAAQRGATTALLVVLLLAFAAYLTGGALALRSVLGPMNRAVKAMDDIAHREGDLSRRLEAEAQDELGQLGRAFNQFVTKMHDVVSQTRHAASGVLEASNQLNGASRTISDSAQKQAASLEQTAASLEQITATVRQNADNASLANQLATSAREVAEKGGAVVSNAVAAMSEINASSRKIADIITTIDEIAFQTNLLALNAAVEAARAGEQGRGFAVVASEVRNLAQRSASAAREIKTLIQDSVRKVEDGATLVNRSGATLDEIVTAVKRVTDVVAEIAAASREQSTGIEEVNRAVTQMDHVTQTNAAQTEELSATSANLSEQARDLQRLVGSFRLSVGGGGTAPAPAAHAPAVPARKAPAARASVAKTPSHPAPRSASRATPIASHPSHPANAPARVATAKAAGHDDGFEEF
jgi:methyl-accepting chemotaxis protein